MSTTARQFYLYKSWTVAIEVAVSLLLEITIILEREHEVCFIWSLRFTENAEFEQEMILLEENDDGYR